MGLSAVNPVVWLVLGVAFLLAFSFRAGRLRRRRLRRHPAWVLGRFIRVLILRKFRNGL